MNAFDPTRAARKIRSRHPDVKPSVAQVALYLASFANGNGTSIRPGVKRIAEETGLHLQTVKAAISWLVERGELRRDKAGHRGSAACFTWIGGLGPQDKGVASDYPYLQKGVASDTPHQPLSHMPSSSSLSGSQCSSPEEEGVLVDMSQRPYAQSGNAHTPIEPSGNEGGDLVDMRAEPEPERVGAEGQLGQGEPLAEPLAPSIWMNWQTDEPLPAYVYREPVLIDPKRYAPGVPVPGGRLYDPGAPLPHDPTYYDPTRHPNREENHAQR